MSPIERQMERTIRRRRALERLGFQHAICGMGCGESRPLALHLDHIAGQAFDKKKVVLICSNCHAERTDLQLNEGLKIPESPPNPLATISNLLLGVSQHLEIMSRFVEDAALELASLVPFLNF